MHLAFSGQTFKEYKGCFIQRRINNKSKKVFSGALRVGVMGFRLRAILSQVPERDFLECFFCDRYHLLMTLGVGNIDQKLLKLLK